MGRGVSSGGGQSSLGYLFGGSEAPNNSPAAKNESPVKSATAATSENEAPAKHQPAAWQASTTMPDVPAGVRGSPNNYFRADGQNTGNFITDRPSTRVHAAPGGGSSLGYLFGGAEGN